MATKQLSFAEQIKHPKWQERRLQIMNNAGFCCQRCGTDEVTLNVHHRRYIKGRLYWEYADNELQCLCENCHKQEHADRELLDRILLEADEYSGAAVQTAIGLLAGYFAGTVSLGVEAAEEAVRVDGHSYDLGILASIAGGAEWRRMVAAADCVKGVQMSPAEEEAYERWKKED